MRVLAIIPAYNEEKSITRVVDNLIKYFPHIDYVIINDGSKDATHEICERKNYNAIHLPINLGLSGAFQTGLKYAYVNGYDYACQFDADGQHKAEYIDDLLYEIQKGYDIAIGSRFLKQKKKMTARAMGSYFITATIWLTTGKMIHDPTSGMRMLNRELIAVYAQNINYDPEPDTISYLIKNGAKVCEVPVTMDIRKEGKSYLTFTRAIAYMLRISISIVLIQWFRHRKQ